MLTSERRRLLSRAEVRAVQCPQCSAEPRQPCLGVQRRDGRRRERKANHEGRIDRALESLRA